MKRDLRIFLLSVVAIMMAIVTVSAQETTGTLEITVKDSAGAVVPNVSLTVVSSGGSTGFRRTVTANDSGSARLLLVPPGTYTVTAAATAGFVERKLESVVVGVGRTTSLDVVMTTSLDATVTVVAEDATGLDLTDPKMQTTITSKMAELIPKGLNFSSVLKYSPATRPEPRSGQYQIDGASGSENVFLVDGQEVTDVLSGALDRNVNLPFSVIQEVQIKTGSYEAEFGGATGGVVSIITKGGGNQFQGEFGMSSRSERFEPTPGLILYSLNGVPSFYTPRKNNYTEFNPTGHLSGPIWKNKLWFSATYAPQILRQNRLIIYRNPTTFEPLGRNEHYFADTRAEKAKFRLDAQPFSRLRVDASIIWNPEITKGAIPGYTSELGTVPAQAGNPGLNGARFLNQTGGRLNSMQVLVGGNYLVTSKIVASARFGHYFLNNLLGTIGFGDVTIPRVQCSAFPLSRSEFPAGFGCQRTGTTSNGVTAFGNTVVDATTRDQLDADVTFSFNAGGSHELKAGFQDNKIGNKVQEQATDIITLRSGTTAPSRVNDYSGVASIVPLPNAIGSGLLSIVQVEGDVSSKNTGLYVQDKWQPNRRLTLTLGVRTERENVPSYARGLPGMSFDFKSKIAPRLGASYDLTGDGKTTIKGFFGFYYDRFKLTLPRGSFGGDQYHQIWFDLLPTDNINNLNRTSILGAGNVPIPGGACPQNSTSPVYGRVRCDKDERISSNAPNTDVTEGGGIDPGIDPFRQREITFIFQRQLSKNYSLSTRYTRKEVLKTIEDVGFVNSEGSTAYLIGNPGYGLAKELLEGAGLLSPKAQRQYDALEVVFSRRFDKNYYFSANYTFSRLYGNYSGLASSDEEGRLDPNVERFFDEPSAGFTVAGGPDNGRLATDRPHVFKAQGTYSLPWDKIKLWKSNTTDFDFFYTISSGSLITSFVNIRGVEQIILNKRGDLGRTPLFSQTDFALRHNIKFGRDGRYNLKFDLDIINLFNQYIVTNRGRNPSGQGGNIASTTNFDILDIRYGLISQAQLDQCAANNNNKPCYVVAFQKFQKDGAPQILTDIANGTAVQNPFYNLDASWQGKRNVRYGVRFVF